MSRKTMHSMLSFWLPLHALPDIWKMKIR